MSAKMVLRYRTRFSSKLPRQEIVMRASTFVGSIALALALMSSSAQASSESAWKEFYARVKRSCVAASRIRNAQPSQVVGFDDRVDVVAMLVSDRTRGSTLSKLCLYDKRAQKAFVDDANMWSAPPQPR
jgi:hypothetical protein